MLRPILQYIVFGGRLPLGFINMLIDVVVLTVFGSEMDLPGLVQRFVLEGVGYLVLFYTVLWTNQVKLVPITVSQHFTYANAAVVNTSHESIICSRYSVHH